MSNSPHVAHVVLSLDAGGLERVVVDLVRNGRRLGQRVAVICLDRPGILADEAEAAGARLICLGKEPGLGRRAYRRAVATLRELRPDVLHTHQIGALFHVGAAARAAGVRRIVHTEHGNHLRTAEASFMRRQRAAWLWWWTARFADQFFCVSEEIASELAARRVLPRARLGVVPNGIDLGPFRERVDREAVRRSLDIESGAPVIGTVGRLTEVKCQDLLLRAFARVWAGNPTARLLLVGDGPLRAPLQALTAQLGLEPAVRFTGYQPRPHPFVAAMDVFALTSRTEGLPLAILEAWAAGLPVVASAVGGIPKLVDHGRTGLLFPAGDEFALAQALTEILAEQFRARSLGSAGRAEVYEHYDSRRMAADYERHYLDLLGCPHGPVDRAAPACLAAPVPASLN